MQLEQHTNLADQCVQGEGLVQINVQINAQQKKINIVDVLKPTDDVLASYEGESSRGGHEVNQETRGAGGKWMVDLNFKEEQTNLKIPGDPTQWTSTHVQYWLLWAVRNFNLKNIKLKDWDMTGVELCNMSIEEFKKRVADDPTGHFWRHIDLLKKCKFVTTLPPKETKQGGSSSALKKGILKMGSTMIVNDANRNGMGHTQLWQFLLELLTDKHNRNIIAWQGTEGEFKLTDPEQVAQLWGARKNKPTMNYEKLSRALRYYYDGDMIAKVSGKRFVYKFVCNLRDLIGYNAEELARLVNEPDPPLSEVM